MKEKINRYARGVFEFDPQKVVTDENNIFAIVDKNKEFKGTFCKNYRRSLSAGILVGR